MKVRCAEYERLQGDLAQAESDLQAIREAEDVRSWVDWLIDLSDILMRRAECRKRLEEHSEMHGCR